ncbi:biopolymer transporter ExbD [Paucibacter sp. B2R-40]|uniref:ExbD/TolR family protein n=1 Tax=Paucibacter sp. B2R-40 TaxID=2893554 RepID=UPI0021E3F4D5|nr:biopolymer transporter ExbD [Paucibacter sp. B2R-40]MCV2355651.1 biopolymer transporter ExbD [Paucibacter sp. B2R-40]
MGMHIHQARRKGDPDIIIDINTTPLIDVMLVLLVMLIITIPIQLHAVNLNLPVGSPPPPAEVRPEAVKIDIDERSTVFWNGEAIDEVAGSGSGGRQVLQAKLQAAAHQAVQPEVHLRPNKEAKYNTFAEVMVAINQAGLQKLGVIGSEQFIDN